MIVIARSISVLSCLAALAIAIPSAGRGETVAIFDAECISKEMNVCLGLLRKEAVGIINKRNECTSWVSQQASAPNKKTKDSWRESLGTTYPLGCGTAQMDFAMTIEDCSEIGKTSPACIRKVEVLTPGDIQLTRDGYTDQLDAWLRMLESAGAVQLTPADKPPVSPVADAAPVVAPN